MTNTVVREAIEYDSRSYGLTRYLHVGDRLVHIIVERGWSDHSSTSAAWMLSKADTWTLLYTRPTAEWTDRAGLPTVSTSPSSVRDTLSPIVDEIADTVTRLLAVPAA